jgi:alpha-1,3-rhamnosyl/mannosyltransferase
MLVNALARLPTATRARFSLLIAGAPGWKTSALHRAAMPLVSEGSVRFLGFISHDDLPWLFAGAALFLFPSLYEGFGIPVVEAMASGVPVVASDIPVMREVVGAAGVFVAPTAPEQWANAIVELVDDPARRAQMRERGLAQAARFTFKQSARRLLDVFDALATGPRP